MHRCRGRQASIFRGALQGLWPAGTGQGRDHAGTAGARQVLIAGRSHNVEKESKEPTRRDECGGATVRCAIWAKATARRTAWRPGNTRTAGAKRTRGALLRQQATRPTREDHRSGHAQSLGLGEPTCADEV